jgi:hypothetical protein
MWRSKVANKVAERWKKGFWRKSRTAHIGMSMGFSRVILKDKIGLNISRRFIEPCKIRYVNIYDHAVSRCCTEALGLASTSMTLVLLRRCSSCLVQARSGPLAQHSNGSIELSLHFDDLSSASTKDLQECRC